MDMTILDVEIETAKEAVRESKRDAPGGYAEGFALGHLDGLETAKRLLQNADQ